MLSSNFLPYFIDVKYRNLDPFSNSQFASHCTVKSILVCCLDLLGILNRGLTFGHNASASGFNPLGWVREKVSPQVKEKQTKEEIEAAKKQAAEQGTRSVFDVQPVAATKATKDGAMQVGVRKSVKKAPQQEVCLYI